LQQFLKDLNQLYVNEPALYELDFSYDGFQWIDFMDSDNSVISFMRKGRNAEKECLVFVCNFTPVYRENYRVGVPRKAFYKEVINSDSENYWGSNKGNLGGLWSDEVPWHGFPHSLNMNLPPLSTSIFKRMP
jgi:1,4-alpha-glucan branching enzyme